jgi:hypothetical protein
MSVSFITTKNGVVTGYFNGDIDRDLYGQSRYGHERVPVPDDAPPPVTGDPVEFYGKD